MNRVVLIFLITVIFFGCKKEEELPPTADFDFVLADLGMVNFVSKSQHGTSFMWEFGDKKISTAESPAHVFDTAGTYTVKLTVSNSKGSAVAEKTVTTATEPYRTVYIKGVAFTKHPPGNIVYVIKSGQTTLRHSADEPFNNSVRDAPVQWAVNPVYKISPVDKDLTLFCVDKISPTASFNLGSMDFNLANYAQGSNRYPASVSFTSPDQETSATIELMWEK